MGFRILGSFDSGLGDAVARREGRISHRCAMPLPGRRHDKVTDAQKTHVVASVLTLFLGGSEAQGADSGGLGDTAPSEWTGGVTKKATGSNSSGFFRDSYRTKKGGF